MRKVIGFFDVIIFGLALTILTFIIIMSNSIFSVKYLNKVIKDEEIYKTLNNKIKDNVRESIGNQFNGYPGVVINTNELIDAVLTEEALEKEFTYIVSNLYNTGKLVIDPGILTEGYKKNFNNYLTKKKINLPQNLQNEITELMVNSSGVKIEVKEFNDNYSKYIIKFKDYVTIIELISLSIVCILVIFTLIVAKEKIKLIYKPLILSSINLFIIGASTKLLENIMKNTSIPIELEKIVTSIKEHLFTQFIKFAIIYFVIAIILIVVRVVLKRRKQNVNNNQR